MAVIKKRKGKMLLSAVIGALLMGLICAGTFLICIQKIGMNVTQLFQMKGNMEPIELMKLSRDISEGEVLLEEDLKPVIVQVKERSILQQDISMYKGKCLKVSLKEGCILSPDMVCSPQKTADDERLLNLSYVRLSEKMRAGDYVDIRISFRNGGDYILLSKKKIQDIKGNSIGEEGTELHALWLKVNEEEILRLASAVVDAYYQEECDIYAIQYVSEMQKAATITYPVNETIKKLLENDPNVTALAQHMTDNIRKELRDALEKGDENK